MSDDKPVQSGTARRKPSRSFASYPLRAATEGIKEAGASGADHSRDAFASYLGHETTNSGGFKRKLASMKDWGLVETRPDRVVITELGMRIAHPRTDDDERNAIREAFLQADVFAETYRDLARGIDLSAERIGSMGVHEHGISPGAKAEFARSFVESAVYVGLGQSNSDSSIRLAVDTGASGGGAPDEADDHAAERNGPEKERGGLESRRRARHSADEPPSTIHQEWSVEHGAVLFELRLDGPLPSTAFATLAHVMQTVEELVAALTPANSRERAAAAHESDSTGDAPK